MLSAARPCTQVDDDPLQAEDRQSVTFLAIVVESAGVVDDDAFPGALTMLIGHHEMDRGRRKCGETVQVRG